MSDLLESASARVQIESLPPAVRDELRRFVDDGDIDLRGGNYRPSAAALFGTYRTNGPPNRFTATSARRSDDRLPPRENPKCHLSATRQVERHENTCLQARLHKGHY